MTVNIISNGNNTSGNNFTLHCDVQKTILGLHNPPVINWTVDGESIANRSTISMESYVNGTLSILSFNPLKTSDAGKYVCHGILYSDALSEQLPIENETESDLEVKSKAFLAITCARDHAVTNFIFINFQLPLLLFLSLILFRL